ncbi:MAG TPA: serine/threonine-protein kinase, partial [Pyrinomonadaceae bacterium]|nr:serine/threonine-protein kinase [Pyrinomonadaceae bacterium]
MSELKLQQCRVDGRYDVLECLGRGSYSEVYVARDVVASNGGPQTVVLKALNTHLQGEPDAELEHTLIVNFRNEAIALDRVRHPQIISRLGHGTAIDLSGRTFHYLVLEYLSGGDLQALCRRKPLDLRDALYFLEQVSNGLEHAHSRGVIHRDIKPQNLLLTADQRVVKIADFGVAKLEAADGAITRVGTDIYAAPEHHPLIQTGQLDTASLAARNASQLTPAADVYSLAKTAYMLLTGEAPRRFSQRPVTEFPTPPAHEGWAAPVLRVLERATQTNPSARYQSVGEFWNELRRAAGSTGEEFGDAREVAPLPHKSSRRAEEEQPAPARAPAPAFERPVEPAPSRPGGQDQRIVIPIGQEDARPAPPRRDGHA